MSTKANFCADMPNEHIAKRHIANSFLIASFLVVVIVVSSFMFISV